MATNQSTTKKPAAVGPMSKLPAAPMSRVPVAPPKKAVVQPKQDLVTKAKDVLSSFSATVKNLVKPPVVKQLEKPAPVFKAAIGEGLDNTTTIAPGPTIAKSQALARGEKVVEKKGAPLVAAPTQASKAKETVKKSIQKQEETNKASAEQKKNIIQKTVPKIVEAAKQIPGQIKKNFETYGGNLGNALVSPAILNEVSKTQARNDQLMSEYSGKKKEEAARMEQERKAGTLTKEKEATYNKKIQAYDSAFNDIAKQQASSVGDITGDDSMTTEEAVRKGIAATGGVVGTVGMLGGPAAATAAQAFQSGTQAIGEGADAKETALRTGASIPFALLGNKLGGLTSAPGRVASQALLNAGQSVTDQALSSKSDKTLESFLANAVVSGGTSGILGAAGEGLGAIAPHVANRINESGEMLAAGDQRGIARVPGLGGEETPNVPSVPNITPPPPTTPAKQTKDTLDNLAQAVKSHPSFKKEGSIQDTLAEGTLLEKNGTYRIAANDVEKQNLIKKGYLPGAGVDSIAAEQGFDSPMAMLEHSLTRRADEKKIAKEQKAVEKVQEKQAVAEMKEQAHVDRIVSQYKDLDVDAAMKENGAPWETQAQTLDRLEQEGRLGLYSKGNAPQDGGIVAPPSKGEATGQPETKERGFVTTLKNSANTDPVIRNKLESFYEPITNKDTVEHARQWINENGADAALAYVTDPNGDVTAARNVTGMLLMKDFQDAANKAKEAGSTVEMDANYDKAIALAEHLSQRATSQGQAIQALSIWSRLTPEGALRAATKIVNDYNNSERKNGTLFDKGGNKKKAAITPKQAEKITRLAEELQNLPPIEPATVNKIEGTEQGNLIPEPEKAPVEHLDVLKKEGTEQGALLPESEKTPIEPATVNKIEGKGQDELPNFLPDSMKPMDGWKPGMINKNARARLVKTAQLLDAIHESVPPSFYDKIVGASHLSLLLNPKTLLRNVIGNSIFMGVENASNAIGTPIDKLVGMITGNRTRTFTKDTLAAQARGLASGAKMGFEDALLGIDTLQGALEKDMKQAYIFRDKILGTAEKGLAIAMKTPDRAFYEAAFADEMANLIGLKKMSKLDDTSKTAVGYGADVTENMVKMAHLTALRRTFQDENAGSSALKLLKKVFNVGKKHGLGDWILKYTQTPGSMLAKGVEYTPLGVLNPIYELAKAAVGKGFNQRKFVDGVARTLVGSTMLTGAGAALAAKGIVTGKNDSGSFDQDNINQVLGKKNYSLNLDALIRFATNPTDENSTRMRPGDRTFTLDWAQPASMPFFIGASLADNGGSFKDIPNVIAQVADSTANVFMEQPFVQGVKKTMMTGSMIQGISEVIQGIPPQYVPTFLNQVRQAVDNTRYSTYDPNWFNEMVNKVKLRVPGLASTLNKSYDPLGREQTNFDADSNLFERFFNSMVNPSFVNTVKEEPELQEAMRLMQELGTREVLPKSPKPKESMFGTTMELSADERRVMAEKVGAASMMAYDKILNGKRKELNDEDKGKFVSEVMQTAYREARIRPYLRQIGVEDVPDDIPDNELVALVDQVRGQASDEKLNDEQKTKVTRKIVNKVVTKWKEKKSQ